MIEYIAHILVILNFIQTEIIFAHLSLEILKGDIDIKNIKENDLELHKILMSLIMTSWILLIYILKIYFIVVIILNIITCLIIIWYVKDENIDKYLRISWLILDKWNFILKNATGLISFLFILCILIIFFIIIWAILGYFYSIIFK